ncbi:phage tail protein [bacterium]|nr:phage tail protein [bacterium]
MTNTIDFILTNAASELISKVLSGKTLNFTRMAVGDGFSYDTTAAKNYTTLVNEVLSIDITKKETLSASSVKITSAFKNTDTQKEFYYREVGLYAQDPDTGEEVLYAYGNRNDAAELITPSGSNVVTKQLIFIISVGDSANVTFNVNADVYALQEDMLDVQANKADKNLANTGMITNCLLEVPQRIKYEFTNNNLTIKAGTVIIIPYGVENLAGNYPVGSTFLNENFKVVDTQFENNKFFIWLEVQDDIIHYPPGAATENAMVFIKPAGNEVTNWGEQGTASGITPGEGELFFYNTETNFISAYSNGTSYNSRFSLPILHISKKMGIISSINNVFNGMGYIGSTIWADKGVRGLIPNGRNLDGSLNNIETETNKLLFATTEQQGLENLKVAFNSTILGINDYYLDESNNIVKVTTDDEVRDLCIVGDISITSGVITSITPYKTFKAVNKSSDKQWLSSLSLPSEKYIDYTLGERGTIYLAPANGWFAIRKDAGFINAQVSLAVWNFDETFEFFRTTMSSPAENIQIAFFVPILKGQKLAVDYDATGLTLYFRFIYAQGEVN